MPERPWLIVAGDLTPLGGMDRANHALALHLADRGVELHVVAHRVWDDVRRSRSVTVEEVSRPFGRHLLGSPLLAAAGRRAWRRLAGRAGCVMVNGGNCTLAGANWVHYVHAAHTPTAPATSLGRAKTWVSHQLDVAAERAALGAARLVICNSRRTARDVVERVGVDPVRVAVVYYGSAPGHFGPVSPADRLDARRALGRPDDRPLVGFVGALGDRRKAFDTVFDAWTALCRQPSWDADLVVLGAGAELDLWRQRAEARQLGDRIAFLGFRPDVARVLAALDAVVHPARYEAYGLSVHEAVCRGLPAIVSASAGVAERYLPELADLLVDDPDDAGELEARLLRWRGAIERYRHLVMPLAASLRARTWGEMSRQIVDLVEQAA
jgi:glycosyltransferase involved in cell wall biosynthesis